MEVARDWLRSEDKEEKIDGIGIVTYWGPGDREMDLIVRLLEDEDFYVRYRALDAVGGFGSGSDSEIDG